MQVSIIATPGSVSTSELVSAISGLLGRFASTQKAREAGFPRIVSGVCPEQHPYEADIIRFRLITEDDIYAVVTVDLRDVTPKYLENMVESVINYLNGKREERHLKRKPLTNAVSMALH